MIDEESTRANDKDEDEMSFVAIIEERVERSMITNTNIYKNLIIERNCIHHMLGDRRNFHEVEAYNGGMVKFDNNSPCTVIGKGVLAQSESTNCEVI